MSFNSGQSRLIELPPKASEGEDSGWGELLAETTSGYMGDELGLDEELTHRLLKKGEMFASYQILKFIGHGGMSDVYVARHMDDRDLSKRRPVALKILRENQHATISLLSLLEREAEICHALASPHVVRIYEYGLSQTGQAFMALELLIGEELFERRKRKKMLSVKETLEVTCQILRGLEAIHAQGVVHRDMKTENIFIVKDIDTGRESVKIIDLGLARYANEDPDDPLMRDTQRLWGTPHYLSPEQTKSPDVDHRSDIYSTGIILYECLTGAYPFDGDTPYAIMHAHQHDSPPMLPSMFDHALDEIIQKALAKRPDFRWQSALEMRKALETWIANTSWDGGLPGIYDASFSGEAHEDALFTDALENSTSGVRDSNNLLPLEPIDRFQRSQSGDSRATPLIGEHSSAAAQVMKKASGTNRFTRSSTGLLTEEGAEPGAEGIQLNTPALTRSPSSGSQPALRLPDRSTPLHSSPIELAETKIAPKTRAPVVSKPLQMPEEVSEGGEDERQQDARMVLVAMALLGLSLIIALVLLLFM